MNDLDRYLAARRAEGATDSSGAFTLSPEHARKKLGESFDWTVPGYYLLRLIQAAVRGGATDIVVRLSRRRVQLEFAGPLVPELLPDRVLSRLIAGTLPKTGPEAHLQPALLAATASDMKRFAYVCLGGPQEDCLLYEDGELRMARGTPLPVQGHRYCFDFEKSGGGGYGVPRSMTELRHAMQATGAEHWALNSRCQACPVPLIVDGRDIAQGLALRAPEVEWFSEVGPFFLGANATPGRSFRCAQSLESRERVGLHGIFCGVGPERWVGDLILLPCALDGPGCINFYSDGVFLESCFQHFDTPGPVIYAPLDGLKTDASGLRVVDDDALQARMGPWAERLESLRGRVLDNVHLLQAPAAIFGGPLFGPEARRVLLELGVIQEYPLPHLANEEVKEAVKAHLVVAGPRGYRR